MVIGGQARVRLSGSSFYKFDVRSAADQESLVRAELSEGAVVTILDGPVAADDANWWKVRTSDGIEGWAVEALSGSFQSLMPISATATPST